MSRPSKKELITKAVFDLLPEDTKRSYESLTTEQIVFRWFVTGRGGDGLRVSEEGMKMFLQAEIAFYDFVLTTKTFKPDQFTVELSKKIKCPYYLGMRMKESRKSEIYIRIYDHKIAMMISIYGTMEDYLNSLGIK